MEWADELAARVSGPQVVNDSKTPSGTVHVGSLRGPVILDVITRALRAAGHETTLLYGVDDLDPDGCPGAPDARRHRDGDGPPAGPHPRPGGRRARVVRAAPRAALHRHVRRPRRLSGSLLLDVRALRGGRHGSVHPDRARQGGDGARGLPARRQRPPPGHLAPGLGDLPELRAGRDHHRHAVGRREGLLRMPAGSREVGSRLRRERLDLAVRRRGEAALEPRMGGPVVAVRRDDRAERQGSRDGRRLSRPLRGDRA